MKYAVTFHVLALLFVYAGVFAVAWLPAQLFCLIFAVTFVYVGFIYGLRRPDLFGKTPAGHLRLSSWFLLAPYLLLTRLTLWLYRATHRRQPPLAEVVPGLWFGRRPSVAELATAKVEFAGILDLAAEFPRCAAPAAHYRSLPLLDGMPVGASELAAGIRWVNDHRLQGPLLVHCALGHGRTGSVIVSWLVLSGASSDVESAKKLLQSLRPGFGMSSAQLQRVQEFILEADAGEKHD